MPEDKQKVQFHYIKSPQFLELRINGVHGSVDLKSGNISMAVFSERPPIPKIVEVEFDNDGRVISETPEGKAGLVRSVPAVLHMDINAAMAIRSWMDDKIRKFFEAHPEIQVESDAGN